MRQTVVDKIVSSLNTFSVSVSGDHIMTEDGRSAIVVRVGEKMAQLEVARFPADDRRGPGLVVVSNVARQSTILIIIVIIIMHLGSRVVSVLDSGAEVLGSNRSRDAVG